MQNFINKGETVTVTAPYTVVSGAGVLVSRLFGIAADDIASGSIGEIVTRGLFDIAKGAATFVDGDPVYWDNTNKVATSTAQSNWLIGVACLIQPDGTAALGALTGSATVRVRLNGGQVRAIFKSTEQTGTGSAQNVAHGLGVVPTRIAVYPSDLSPATVGSVVLTEGTNTSTNVVVTVTASKKFFVIAWAE